LELKLEEKHDCLELKDLNPYSAAVIASALKAFFRATPGSLFPFALQDKFFAAAGCLLFFFIQEV
jgi:hypothetical protein